MPVSKDDKAPKRPRSRRKLTPFLCQEMLYDFALERLDDDRRSAVNEYLKGDADCRNILDGIRKGLEYTETLGAISVKPDVLKHLGESENVISLGRRYSSYGEWDEKIRWSINAVIIVLLTAGICSVIPWSHLKFASTKKTENVELAQLPHAGDQQLSVAEEQKEADVAADQGSGDEEIGDGDDAAPQAPTAKLVDKSAPVPPKAAAAKSVASGDNESDDEGEAPAAPAIKPGQPMLPTAPPVVAAAVAPPASKIPKPGGASAVAASSASEKADEDVGPKNSAAAGSDKEEKAKGFVMRAFMTLSNLDELGPKITENITELGGDKAGEVELGWKRGSGRYYHFTLPEENQDKLLEKLRAYGPVRLSKDPHSRVMPPGQVRFILWVESAH